MANTGFSDAKDLTVGAGELYLKRKQSDGTYSPLHHCGNADAFEITNDVTKIEKNSSMNKQRLQMASVVTAIKPSASITLNEYDPANLSYGLYGTEGIHTQVAKTITDGLYPVQTVPGIIEIVDDNGDAYFNINGVSIAPSVAVVASIGAVTKETALTSDGTVTVAGTYTGTTTKDYYIKVKTAPTAVGDLAGMVVSTANSLVGPYTDQPVFSAGLTTTVSMGSGITATIAVTSIQDFVVGEIYTFKAIAATTAYTSGIDFLVEEQSSRAGLIKIPEGSSIPVGATVKVTVTIPAGTYPKISGGNAGEIEAVLVYIADPNIGGKYNIQGWSCKISSDGAVPFIGTDFASYKLKVDFLADEQNHPDDPYYKAVLVGKA